MNKTLRLCPFVLPFACLVGAGPASSAQARTDRGIELPGERSAAEAPPVRDTVVRLRSLAGFHAAGRLMAPPPMPPLMARNVGSSDFLGIGKEDLSPSVLTDSLEHIAKVFLERADPGLAYGLSRFPGFLAFRGDSEGARRFDLALDVLEAELEPRIAVTARLVELAAGTGNGAGPGTGTVAERFAGGRELWSARSVGPAGWPLALGRTELLRYVQDYEVEVAEEAKVAVPITAAAFTGVSLVVVPHVLSGSTDLVLMSQGVVSRPHRDVERRRVGVEGVPALDVPSLELLAWTASERIENGSRSVVGAVGMSSEGRSLALVVSAERLSDRREVEDLAVLPLTALASRSLQSGYLRCATREGAWEHATPAPHAGEDFGRDLTSDPAPIGREHIEGMVQLGLEPWLETTDIQLLGGCLVVTGPPEACAQARRIVAQLEDSLLVNGGVEVRVPLRAPDDAEVGELLQSVSLPGLRGRTHTVVRGIETLDLDAYHAEIASKSAILNPSITPVFHGLVATVSLRAGAGETIGSFLVELLESGPVTRRPIEGRDGGDLDIRRVVSTSSSHDGPFPGAGLLLGDGPDIERDGRTWRSRIEVRAR